MNVRTHQDVYKSYLNYLYERTGNQEYLYKNFFGNMSSEDKKIVEGRLYKEILELCYDKDYGLYYFIKFIIGDMKHLGFPKPYRYNSLLKKWDDIVKKHKRLVVESSRGHGKCQTGDSLVTLSDGSRKRLDEMRSGDEIISINDSTLKQEVDYVDFMKYVGDKLSYKISLDSGKSLTCASTHKFLTNNGWKELSEISVGDFIATPRNITIKEEQTISEDMAWLLGWIISEGTWNTGLLVHQHNTEVLEEIFKVATRANINARIFENHIRLSTKNIPFRELQYRGSYDKFIPEEMFKQPEKVKIAFLSSLVEGDGYLDVREHGDSNIVYASMSEKLIDDLAHLLLTLGVHSIKKKKLSSVVIKRYGEKKHVYSLKINGRDCFNILKKLSFVSKKDQQSYLLNRLSSRPFNTNKDVIPQDMIEPYYKKLYNNLSREKLSSLISSFDETNRFQIDNLRTLAESDIYWDRVISLDELSVVPMYDIQVRNNHNYISNDIISHNTMFFTEILNIYDMFLFPFRRVIIVSASQEQANRILTEIKTIIDTNDVLRSKSNPSRWAAESIGYNKGYILAKGLTAEIRGEHVDRIVLDDILRGDNKVSMSYIEEFVDATLSPMLINRNGQFIIVGTPMSESDIFAVLERRIKEAGESSSWKLYKYPAIISMEEKILQSPDRFTFDMLMEEKAAIGSLKFNREYQLEIYSRDASLFPYEIVKPALDAGRDATILYKARDNSRFSYIIGVDVARSGSVSADFSVATVLEYDYNSNTKSIVYLWRKKGLKIVEQAREIANLAKKFGNAVVVVETNNMGQDMIDTLVDDFNVHVESYTTGSKKVELIRFLISSFEYEQFVIPQGDYESIQMFSPLLEELERFSETTTPAGNIKYEGLGGHDDCVISIAIANKGTQEFSAPIAVMDFDKGGGSIYDGSSFYSKESELMYKIRNGLI